MTYLMIIVGWLLLSAVVGVFASGRRNRSGFGWFVLAVVISPLVAFLFLAAMATEEKKMTAQPAIDWRGLLMGAPGQPVTITPKRPKLSSDNWSRLKAKTDW
jgi:hypothetical protein